MRYTLLATVACAAMGHVQALSLPTAGDFFQVQPTFRGSFPRTPCITVFSAANGSAALINDCTAANQQRAITVVQPPGTLGQLRVFNTVDSTFCLQALETNNGAKVTISSCVDGDARQQWLWDTNGLVQWGQSLNKCLDLTDGNLANGNQLQIWDCDFSGANKNQIWSANTLSSPLQEVPLANTGICMGARSSANGSPVLGVSCDDTTARKVWVVPQPGHGNTGVLQVAFGTDGAAPVKCLDVTDGVVANGTKLQLWDCTFGPNQVFFPPGFGSFRWAATNLLNPLCVDLTDGILGNQLQIWSCIGGPNQNQNWTSVPPPQTAI